MRILFILLLFYHITNACTSIIISGRITKDGRPILWKQRDSNYENNSIVHFKGEKFYYIGIANSYDTKDTAIWVGVNSEGFAIMNTASYNLVWDKENRKIELDQEGILMKKVLGKCKNIKEFEQYLISTNGKRGVEANFGVIDAYGGAAYFEVSPDSFVKYDVNDLRIAPEGYLIRTNYSFYGDLNKGYGFIRYKNLQELVFLDKNRGKLDEQAIILNYSRSLYNDIINKDGAYCRNRFLYFNDCIVRYTTVSSTIIKGAISPEKSELTELFVIPGWPLKAVVIPFRVKDVKYLGDFFINNDLKPSFINKKALELKYKSVLFNKGSGKNYLDLNTIVGNGSLQKIIDFDRKTLVDYKNINFSDKKSIERFYTDLKNRIINFYKHL